MTALTFSKTNHSHPWNPQEKGMFMKFLHNWHTHTHTHSESVSEVVV